MYVVRRFSRNVRKTNRNSNERFYSAIREVFGYIIIPYVIIRDPREHLGRSFSHGNPRVSVPQVYGVNRA